MQNAGEPGSKETFTVLVTGANRWVCSSVSTAFTSLQRNHRLLL